MSMSVDQRIVEMRFDNKQFEQNVSTTMSSIDKLKQSLNFKGAAESLDGLNSAANKVDFRQLENTACQAGFSIRDVWLKVATVFEYQIARRITHAAGNIAKALTIDPIFTGFKEYETQIGAIQTILANTQSKGTTLDDVNGALDELNAYADKTIYNFTEMTRNIGTFTAAGVDLDTSVQAIKGIANLAAVSGSTSQQASTAMYQLSQALSSGTVKLMDWNSVVNAGMGGQVFQDALKETARVHGIAIDDLIKKEGSFRETLSHGWLSSEILTETLAKFTGDLSAEQLKTMGYTEKQIEGILKMGQTANDAATKVKTFSQLLDTLKEAAQSGWSQTWEIVVGDFEEAKDMLTKVSDTIGGIIGESAEARNKMLGTWKVLGGRTELIDAITHAFDAVMSIVQAVSEAMKEVFPPLTAEKLVAFCTGLKELAKNFAEVFKVNGKTTTTFNNLKRTLKGVFAIVDIVRQVFVALVKAVGKVLGVTGKVGEGLLYFTAIIGDWLVAISDALDYSGILEFAIGGLGRVLELVIGVFKNFGRAVSESFLFKAASEGLNAFLGLIHKTKDNTEILTQAAENIKTAWTSSGLYKFLTSVWKVIKSVASGIGKVFGNIADAFGRGDWGAVSELLNSLLSGGFIAGLIVVVKKIYDLFSFGGLRDSLKDIMDNIADVIDNVGGVFEGFQNRLNAEALKAIATAIAILVGSLVVLTFLDEKKLSSAIAALTLLMGAITLIMKVTNKGKGLKGADLKESLSGILGGGAKSTFDAGKFAISLVGIASALLIAAGAFAIIGSMNWDEIKRGLVGMLGVTTMLVVAQIVLAKFATGSGDIKKGARVMRSMALTLLLMCAPLAIIGSMEWHEIARGLTGLLGVLSMLVLAQIALAKFGGGAGSTLVGAGAMMVMAIAITAILPALLILGHMPWDVLIKAGTSLVVLLASLAGAQIMYSRLASGGLKTLAGAVSISIMALSIDMLLPVLKTFAQMDVDKLIKSVIGLTAVLAALAGVQIMYSKLASNSNEMLAGAGSIAIMAASLLLLIPTMQILANMSIGQWLQSIIGITAILAALGGAMTMFTKLGGGPAMMTSAAQALFIMAGALLLIAPAIAILGSLSVGQAITGLATLGAALLIIVGIAHLLKPVVGVLMMFGWAVQSIGVGMLAAGAGMVLFGVGLTAISAGIVALTVALSTLVGGLGTVCVALVSFVAAIVEGIIRGLGAGIVAFCEILIDSLPLIADVVYELLAMVCDVIVRCVPKLVEACLALVLGLCDACEQFIPPIVSALVRLIAGVISALAGELPGLIKSLVDLLFSFVEGVINALGGMNPEGLLQALKNVGMLTIIIAALAAIAALTPAAMIGVVGLGLVVAELSLVLSALSKLSGMQDSIAKGGDLLQTVGTAIGQFVGGLVGGFAKGATEDLPEIATNLAGFADNIGSFLDIAPKLASSMAGLAGASIIDGISRIFNFGQSSMDKLQTELPKLGIGLAGFAAVTKNIDADKVKGAAEAAQAVADMTNHIPNSGGMVSWFTGDNSIAKFSKELIALGVGLTGFAVATMGVNGDKVKGAAEAAQAVADMTNHIPNSGGVVSWFAGDNSISKFSGELVNLGLGIATFSAVTSGVKVDTVKAAVDAATAVAEMTNNIPNSGGVVSWFAGDNSVAKFSKEMVNLGVGIAGFALTTSGIDPVKVTAAAAAASAIADMTKSIPNSGGVVSWFAGDNSLAKFSGELSKLGMGISAFAWTTSNVDPEKVKTAAQAAITIAGITEYIPNSGGVASWFTGETSLSKFAEDMGNLGKGLSKFSNKTGDIDPAKVSDAANAAIAIAGITNYLPNENGAKQWFTGETSLSKFAEDMGSLGKGISKFANKTSNVDPAKVIAAAQAAVAIADITKYLPNENGAKQWFTGETSLSKFADDIGNLGKGLSKFASNTGDIDSTKVRSAADAAIILAQLTEHVPNQNGVKQWFTGEASLSKFGDELPKLGKGLKKFSDSVKDLDSGAISTAKTAATTVIAIAEGIPPNSKYLSTFGDNIKEFGSKMKSFISSTKNISKGSTDGVTVLVALCKEVTTISAASIKNVATAIKELTAAAKDMEKNIKSSMKDAGKKAIEGYISGMNDKLKDAKTAIADLVEKVAAKASDKATAFEGAGKDCVKGFAKGIRNNKYLATGAGSEVGKAALEAAKKAVDSNSPSKEFMKLGRDSDIGFANGLTRYAGMVYDSAYDMGKSGLTGLGDSISKISRLVENGIDTQPRIRPVLDLSDVQNGVGRIGGLFAKTPLGVNANLGAISSMMNSRQNGTNIDVVDAIKDLRDDISKIKNNTYHINGITYDDGSNIADAVSTLIRAAKIERRV